MTTATSFTNSIPKQISSTKAIFVTSLCSFVEIFDFSLYSFFAAIIGNLFFNNHSANIAILISVSIFGIGFIARPLGSIILGAYTDRHGARSSLTACVTIMAIGSLLIACAPLPTTAGNLGIIMLITGRILQGFSAGGQIGSGIVVLIDNAPIKHKTFVTCWQLSIQSLNTIAGAFLGYILFTFLSADALNSWGWRIPFLLSLVIIPIGFYLRAILPSQEPIPQPKKTFPLVEILTNHKRHFFLSIGANGFLSVSTYILSLFLPTYFALIGMYSQATAYIITMSAAAIGFCVNLSGAFLVDKIMNACNHDPKIRNNILLTCNIIYIFAIIGVFSFSRSLLLFTLFYFLAVIAAETTSSCKMLHIAETFPRHIRGSAISVIYASYVAIFGGTAQIIVTALLNWTNNFPAAPLFWLIPISLLGTLSILFFKPIRYP